METLHDICMQLMKPAKDLAQWNFPLAEMLATYTRLLNDADDFKFSESGLVVENSANVYGKRVEFLFAEALSLTDSLLKQQEEKKNPKEYRRASKKIDFDDFELLTIEAKDTFLKDEHVKKPLKLLPKQFVKVEKRLPETLTETIIDVHADIIGKKYAFRCNQDITKSGMLTDELTEKEFYSFEKIPSLNTDLDNSINEPMDNSDILQDSGYQTFDHHDFDDDLNNSCDELEENLINVTNEQIEPVQTNNNEQNEQTCIVEYGVQNVNSTSDAQEINSEMSIDRQVNPDLQPENQTLVEAEKQNPTEAENQNPVEAGMQNPTEAENLIPESQDSVEVEKQMPEKRQSKRLKNAEMNANSKTNWEPIPFDQGIPDKLPKKRREFKLPCHIDLLTKTSSRRRKVPEKKSLTQFLKEQEPPSKKDDSKTPATEIFSVFRKELDEFKKSFELCLGSYLYDAIPTITMGFDSVFGGRNLPLDSPAYSTNMDDVVISMEPDSPGMPDSYTPPTSPEDFGNYDQHMSTATTSKRNYDEIVQKKIKDVHECRKRTTLEENVIRWHETIKPKLIEAEQRSSFDIHDYGTQILSALSKKDERKILLSNVARNRPAAEVARYFSATLQLANTYNVDIKQSNDVSNIELVLLNENRNKAADNFLPSTSSKKSRKSS